MGRMQHLASLIAELTRGDGVHSTAVRGLHLSRWSTTGVPRQTVDRAVLCVVAQGEKGVLVHDARYLYDPSTYFVLSLDLPLVGEVVRATPDAPCLGVSLELDFAELGGLALEAGLSAPPEAGSARNASRSVARGVSVSPVGDDLLDAVIRLVGLLRRPERIPVLAPLVRREVFYELLVHDRTGLVRRATAEHGQVRRIAAGLEWLKQNAARPIRMEDLAREVHMSVSTMHTWFRAVTAMSPLQFQKQLRLQEARRLLLSEGADAKAASQRVGYESPSQFSREYRRLFGAPPGRDIARLRAAPDRAHDRPRRVRGGEAISSPTAGVRPMSTTSHPHGRPTPLARVS